MCKKKMTAISGRISILSKLKTFVHNKYLIVREKTTFAKQEMFLLYNTGNKYQVPLRDHLSSPPRLQLSG